MGVAWLSLSQRVPGARVAAGGDTVTFRLRVTNAGETGPLIVRLVTCTPAI
jgi:hypothetical protein